MRELVDWSCSGQRRRSSPRSGRDVEDGRVDGGHVPPHFTSRPGSAKSTSPQPCERRVSVRCCCGGRE